MARVQSGHSPACRQTEEIACCVYVRRWVDDSCRVVLCWLGGWVGFCRAFALAVAWFPGHGWLAFAFGWSVAASGFLAHRALKRNGEVVLIDVFPGQEDGVLSRSVRDLELALRTHGRQMLSPKEVEQALVQHDFSEIQFAHLPAVPRIFGVVLASK